METSKLRSQSNKAEREFGLEAAFENARPSPGEGAGEALQGNTDLAHFARKCVCPRLFSGWYRVPETEGQEGRRGALQKRGKAYFKIKLC